MPCPYAGGGLGEPGSGQSSFSTRASPLAGSAPAPAFVVGSPLSRVAVGVRRCSNASSASTGGSPEAAAAAAVAAQAGAPGPGHAAHAASPVHVPSPFGAAVADGAGRAGGPNGPPPAALNFQKSFVFAAVAGAGSASPVWRCPPPGQAQGGAPPPQCGFGTESLPHGAYEAAAASEPGPAMNGRSVTVNWDDEDEDEEVFVPIRLLLVRAWRPSLAACRCALHDLRR
jgi:hypothetical protein